MTKQDGVLIQIERLLVQGRSSREIIDLGYASSSVYKVQRAVRANASKSPSKPSAASKHGSNKIVPADRGLLGNGLDNVFRTLDPEVETHPEVVQLKLDLRKVELQRQITEVKAPTAMEDRLERLEKSVAEMSDLVTWLVLPDGSVEEH